MTDPPETFKRPSTRAFSRRVRLKIETPSTEDPKTEIPPKPETIETSKPEAPSSVEKPPEKGPETMPPLKFATPFTKTLEQIATMPIYPQGPPTLSTDITKLRRSPENGGHGYCGPYGPHDWKNMCYKCMDYPEKYYQAYGQTPSRPAVEPNLPTYPKRYRKVYK